MAESIIPFRTFREAVKVKKGDKVRLNRQGSETETVIKVSGTSVWTDRHPNTPLHITKVVKLDEAVQMDRLSKTLHKEFIKTIKHYSFTGRDAEFIEGIVWGLENYQGQDLIRDIASSLSSNASDTFLRDVVIDVLDKVDRKFSDKVLKQAGIKRI